jgi:hypothetical protein
LNDMYYRFRLKLPPSQSQGYSSFGQKPTVFSDRQFSSARSAPNDALRQVTPRNLPVIETTPGHRQTAGLSQDDPRVMM